MVLGKLPVRGCPTIWITVGQGPMALAVGAGGGCLDIFILIYAFFPLSPTLWETARYRLKYCLKGPLDPKQPTNQPGAFNRINMVVVLLYSQRTYIEFRPFYLFCIFSFFQIPLTRPKYSCLQEEVLTCVTCATNYVHRELLWIYTYVYILERSHFPAHSARDHFPEKKV